MALALAFTPTSNAAAGALIGATEPTQMMNNIELIMQTIQQAQQLAHQFKQMKAILTNFRRLSPQMLSSMTDEFEALAANVTQGQRLAFGLARADEEYQRRFSTRGRPERFSARYLSWWRKNRATVKATLSRVGLEARDFRDQSRAISRVRELSRHAQTRDSILQAANEMAAAQAIQLQQLRSVAMHQLKLQGHAMTAKEEQEVDRREAIRRSLRLRTPSGTNGRKL